ncbi:hypothetical protein [Kribbella speibonae]|uniref:Uncharacterized protein n=1 Tax=Kribbella speibonae TaxID=1572660 RepID=A0ABY1ZWZ5_9ACTN|nr:hypothetical protein [Kribbella speibonae]TCC19428.1 hypothetical protein E0H58_31470 [Kribbella speibonae]
MSVQMRLSGDPEEIEVMVKVLAVVFQLDGSGLLHTNHGTAGVRCYLTARIPNKHDRSETTTPDQHR